MQKLKLKNPNFVVSKLRLSVRNMPLSLDEGKLKEMFLKAAKGASSAAKPRIKQVSTHSRTPRRPAQACLWNPYSHTPTLPTGSLPGVGLVLS